MKKEFETSESMRIEYLAICGGFMDLIHIPAGGVLLTYPTGNMVLLTQSTE